MMLFLLQDTLREIPVGFEKRRRNIFDPEEDEAHFDTTESSVSVSVSVSNASHHGNIVSNDYSKLDLSVSDAEIDVDNEEHQEDNIGIMEDEDDEDDDDSKINNQEGGKRLCARQDCNSKPRFDSVFCSDACGVACLESDLLRTFHYTSDIHPSLLRS